MKISSILLALLWVTTANSYPRSVMIFLTLPQSPEAIGRAGIYLDSEDADPLSVFTQPGQWGLLANSHRMQAASYVDDTQWMPDLLTTLDMRYSSRAMYYGFDRAALKKYFDWNTPLSFAVGYSEINFDYGESERRDANNQIVGTFHPYENAKGVTFSGGLRRQTWQFGFGLTTKFLQSKLGPVSSDGSGQATANRLANDAGIQFHWNTAESVFGSSEENFFGNSFSPILNFNANYSMLNIGRAVSYTDDPSRADPLPRMGVLGFSANTGLQHRLPNGNEVKLLSIGAGIQASNELIGTDSDGNYHYRNLLGGIQPYNQFVGGQSNSEVDLSECWELSIFETLTLRRGEVRGGEFMLPYRSEGFGLSISGFMKLFRNSPIRNLDLQYHQSKILFGDLPDFWYGANNDMTYRQVTLGWKY